MQFTAMIFHFIWLLCCLLSGIQSMSVPDIIGHILMKTFDMKPTAPDVLLRVLRKVAKDIEQNKPFHRLESLDDLQSKEESLVKEVINRVGKSADQLELTDFDDEIAALLETVDALIGFDVFWDVLKDEQSATEQKVKTDASAIWNKLTATCRSTVEEFRKIQFGRPSDEKKEVPMFGGRYYSEKDTMDPLVGVGYDSKKMGKAIYTIANLVDFKGVRLDKPTVNGWIVNLYKKIVELAREKKKSMPDSDVDVMPEDVDVVAEALKIIPKDYKTSAKESFWSTASDYGLSLLGYDSWW